MELTELKSHGLTGLQLGVAWQLMSHEGLALPSKVVLRLLHLFIFSPGQFGCTWTFKHEDDWQKDSLLCHIHSQWEM